MNKKNTFILLSILIVFSILFLMVYYYLNNMCINEYYLEGLVFAIPVILIGLIEYLYFNKKYKYKVMTIILSITIIISIIATSGYFVFIKVKDLMSEVTDINKYERVLEIEAKSNSVYQFPTTIPQNAEEINFFYRPKFLQGAMQIQLRLKMSEKEIQDYIDKYSNKSIKILDENDQLEDFGIFAIGNRVREDRNIDGYTLYLLESEHYEEHSWNHGKIVFIVVNKYNNEIIFQTEIW